MQRLIFPALRAALAAIGAPDTIHLALDEPRNPGHGDLSSGVALELAAALQIPPIELARRIVEIMQVDHRFVASVEVAAPGFINFRLKPAAFHMLLEGADSAGNEHGNMATAFQAQARIPSSMYQPVATGTAGAHRHARGNPYWNVQYAYARISAIERNAASEDIAPDPAAPFTPLVSSDELGLIRAIIRLPKTTDRAARECEPLIIFEYLGALADATHRLLDTARIIAAPPDVRDARLRLLAIAKHVLRTQLEVLGIEAAERV